MPAEEVVRGDDTNLLVSKPGQWIDRFGRPRDKPAVRRILVLKADHIGDLLITDSAFALLRRHFPDARLELLCGAWNVELARRLRWFDAVYEINFLNEVSDLQRDAKVAEACLAEGMEELARLNLGSYDLAIDMRHDRDTRPILQNIDARIRAGYGTSAEFPFLDILLPRYGSGRIEGPTELYVLGREIAALTPSIATGQPVAGNAVLSARRHYALLEIRVEGARSPKDCGLSNDHRLLGVGLEAAAIHVAHPEGPAPEAVINAAPFFGDGWGAREAWGTWTIDRHARLAIPIPAEMAGKGVRIDLTFRGHVGAWNPDVRCVIRSIDEPTADLAKIEFAPERKRLTASIVVPIVASSVRLASRPFALRPGRYSGSLCLHAPAPLPSAAELSLVVRRLKGQAAIARQILRLGPKARGIVSLDLDLWIETAGEELRLDIETGDVATLEGCRIEYVALQAADESRTRLPNAHMRDRAELLVLRIAQLFSEAPPIGRSASEARADLLAADSELPEEVRAQLARLDRWRSEGSIVVGLAMGCNSAIRKWSAHYFVELARALMEEGDVRVVFVGGKADQEEAKLACAQLRLPSSDHELCGRTRLHEVGALLRRLDIFIGNNSGLTHFAGTVGVRTIGVYAGTNHPREWGPIGQNASWIYRDEPCAPCHLGNLADCKYGHRCLALIHPSDVLAAVAPELRSIAARRRAGLRLPAGQLATSEPVSES
jgi:ADP-heptose:LPS heptosyltransferase